MLKLTIFLLIGLLVLVLLILLFIKISLVIKYDKELSINIKYLFFNFDLLSLAKKPKKPKKEKSKEKPIKEKTPPEKSKDFLEILNKINKALSTKLYGLKKGIIINKLKMNLQVGVNDAKETALLCGHIYNAVSLIDTLLVKKFKEKDKNLSITPRFNEMVFNLYFLLDIKATPATLLAIALLVFINIIKKN